MDYLLLTDIIQKQPFFLIILFTISALFEITIMRIAI
jgi:hypothetical protein